MILIAQWGRYALQLVSIVVLSWLLSPAEYGLVALGTAVTGFAVVLGDFGLSLAALQAERLSQEQKSALFWVNTLAGGLMAVVVALLAGPASEFFGDDRLATVLWIAAPSFLLRGMSVQLQVEINRAERFHALAAVQFFGDLAGILVVVPLALAGAGFVSLALQAPTAALCGVILAAVASRWRPSAPSRRAQVRPLLLFGGNTLLAHLANYATTNLDTLLIGKYDSAQAVGHYSRAFQLMNMGLQQVAAPLTRVIVPRLARAGSLLEREQILGSVQRALSYTLLAFVSLLAATAEPAVLTVLGPEWQQSAPLMGALAIGAVFQTMAYGYYWGYTSTARSGLLLASEVTGRSVMVVGILLAAPFGTLAIAFAVSGGQAVLWALSTFVFFPRTGLHSRTLVAASAKPLLIMGTAFVATVTTDHLGVAELDSIVRLLVLITVWLVAVAGGTAAVGRADAVALRTWFRATRKETRA